MQYPMSEHILTYPGRPILDADHIKWLLSSGHQKREAEYAYHMRAARVYRNQAESLFAQARRPTMFRTPDPGALLQSAYLAMGFAKSEIEQAKAIREMNR